MDGIPIFTIWLTEKDWDAMPYIYELCIASWQINNPNREIIIYTNNELHLSFLDRKITKVIKLKDKFSDILEKAKTIAANNIQHQSDIIRYSILQEENGVYLDTDVLLHSNIDHLLYDMEMMDYNILFPLEDENMICNCMLISREPNKKVFEDIIQNYEENYIKHSYLFNSQKYLWLMYRRYKNDILLYKDNTLFKPGWLSKPEEFETIKEDVHAMGGIGFHLTGTNENYKKLRQYLDSNCYNLVPQNDIQCLMKDIINKYMKLMKEADK